MKLWTEVVDSKGSTVSQFHSFTKQVGGVGSEGMGGWGCKGGGWVPEAWGGWGENGDQGTKGPREQRTDESFGFAQDRLRDRENEKAASDFPLSAPSFQLFVLRRRLCSLACSHVRLVRCSPRSLVRSFTHSVGPAFPVRFSCPPGPCLFVPSVPALIMGSLCA